MPFLILVIMGILHVFYATVCSYSVCANELLLEVLSNPGLELHVYPSVPMGERGIISFSSL